MKRIGICFLAAVVLLSLMAGVTFGATPVDTEDPALVMYADHIIAQGSVVPVKMGPYNGWTHAQRLCPENALGEFDAMPGADSFNERFFGAASREWTEYGFDAPFMNVDNASDIEFCEVTWGSGNSWHVEAVQVYLLGATVRNEDGEVVEYGAVDDGIGYYAGIAWNRTGIAYVSEARRIEIAESYLPGVDRDYDSNEFEFVGTFGWTEFNLPPEVVCAEGIRIVDITADVYNEGGVDGHFSTGNGSLVTALNCPIDGPEDVLAESGYVGNTDGYDLDAIRVYRCIPGGDDTATGMGTPILSKGNWFMYNEFTECDSGSCGSPGMQCFDLQAGNPKEGENFIGEYCVAFSGYDGDGNMTFTATYDIDGTLTKDGYIYDIVVVDEHLGIDHNCDDVVDFKAVPGLDDNEDFEVPFVEECCPFYIFAHFGVEYR